MRQLFLWFGTIFITELNYRRLQKALSQAFYHSNNRKNNFILETNQFKLDPYRRHWQFRLLYWEMFLNGKFGFLLNWFLNSFPINLLKVPEIDTELLSLIVELTLQWSGACSGRQREWKLLKRILELRGFILKFSSHDAVDSYSESKDVF